MPAGMATSNEIGSIAEKIAERYYLARGYWLLARNFRQKTGEIDLILQRAGELLFVEVKGRREFRLDEAWHPRWRRKKSKINRTARIFLAKFPELYGERDEIRLEIVFVTQGRVSERFEGEPFF